MAIKATCPNCSKTLEVPDGLAGKQATCTQCEQRFEIEAEASPSSPADVDSAKPRPRVAPESNWPTGRTPADEVPPADSLPAVKPRGEKLPRALQSTHKPDTAVAPGAASLPELALRETEQREGTTAESPSRAWITVACLCGSFVVSVLLLVVDFGGASRTPKKAPLDEVVDVYFAESFQLEARDPDIHRALQQAVQALSREDTKEARKYLLEVRDLLHRANRPEPEGFTGNDPQLLRLVNELLR